MIDYETYVQIRNLFTREGLTYSQISDELDLDPRTVARWANEKKYRSRKTSRRESKLDPFKNTILAMLEKHHYSSRQIFQHIKQEGFTGGRTIVADYVRKVRPPKTKPFLKLVFAPGECAQVDWGSYGTVRVGSTKRRLSFFVMVLCYSRLMYVEFTVSQTMEHFLGCHQNALQFFGKVPEKIMVDNLKSAVLKRIIGKSPVFNPRYVDFADHYGFTIVPCNVGKGNEKGRVENGVGYVKKNLLNGLDITGFEVLEPLCRDWLDTVANVRIHGATGRKPIEMFTEERSSLRPLPAEQYDIGVVKQVRASRQFRVTVDTNQYSVPAQLAGVALTAKLYPDRLCFYHDHQLVVRHTRSYDRRQDFEDPDHPKALLAQRKKAKDQALFMRFMTLSDKAQIYYQKMKEKRLNVLHHIRQIVALSEIYPKEQLALAIEDALFFCAYSSEYIVNLLEQRSRPVSEPGVLHLTRKSDLLNLTIQPPDMDIYNTTIGDPNV